MHRRESPEANLGLGLFISSLVTVVYTLPQRRKHLVDKKSLISSCMSREEENN